jgi:hypothetical protein
MVPVTGVRRRRLRLGISLGAAAIVLFFVLRAAVFVIRFTLIEPGKNPTIISDGLKVPVELITEAYEEGSLFPGEHIGFVFVPGGRTFADALFAADTFIVRRSRAGPRRFLLKGSTLRVARQKQPGQPRLKGYLILSRGAVSTDTLYDDLGGLDLTRLLISLYVNGRKLERTKK